MCLHSIWTAFALLGIDIEVGSVTSAGDASLAVVKRYFKLALDDVVATGQRTEGLQFKLLVSKSTINPVGCLQIRVDCIGWF